MSDKKTLFTYYGGGGGGGGERWLKSRQVLLSDIDILRLHENVILTQGNIRSLLLLSQDKT